MNRSRTPPSCNDLIYSPKKHKNKNVRYPPNPWKEISTQAIELITNLLQVETHSLEKHFLETHFLERPKTENQKYAQCFFLSKMCWMCLFSIGPKVHFKVAIFWPFSTTISNIIVLTLSHHQVKMRKRYSVEQSLIHPWLQVGKRKTLKTFILYFFASFFEIVVVGL